MRHSIRIVDDESVEVLMTALVQSVSAPSSLAFSPGLERGGGGGGGSGGGGGGDSSRGYPGSIVSAASTGYITGEESAIGGGFLESQYTRRSTNESSPTPRMYVYYRTPMLIFSSIVPLHELISYRAYVVRSMLSRMYFVITTTPVLFHSTAFTNDYSPFLAALLVRVREA